MPNIGAIDIGSNAMRLAVGSVGARGAMRVVETLRDPVRLGGEVFGGKSISEHTTIQALDALQRFRALFRKWNVTSFRAVGTSALREAPNRDQFLERVKSATAIDVHVISGEEEARLIHRAVARAVPMGRSHAILIDIGGGSAEISIGNGETLVAAETFGLGAVRLLQVFHAREYTQEEFPKLVREYTAAARRRFAKEIGTRKISLCIGTGGNVECLRDLRQTLLGRADARALTHGELTAISHRLQQMSVKERMTQLGLRADRADVIVPASLVLLHLMEFARVDRVVIPKVGLREGVLLDLVPSALGRAPVVDERQALVSARELGERYRFDEMHARAVTAHALTLFDALRSLHHFGAEERVLLEVAAMLHDVGHVVNAAGHHKHSAYLISASPLIGLDDHQKNLVALIVRYHRKGLPKQSHDAYASLTLRERGVILKLAAILRVADALDCEHAARVREVRCVNRGGVLRLYMRGHGDLLLERWAVERNRHNFESIFHLAIEARS